MRRTLPLATALVLALVASAASAQQPAAAPPAAARPTAATPAPPPQQQALTPAQQAELAKQNAEMIQAAQKVLQMIDGGQLAQLWDGASVVAKRAITRDNFVAQVSGVRRQLGAVAGRGQAVVTRVRYNPGASVPEGLYVNVSFPTRFANAPQPVRELVTFRLDEDKVWRLAGYSLPNGK